MSETVRTHGAKGRAQRSRLRRHALSLLLAISVDINAGDVGGTLPASASLAPLGHRLLLVRRRMTRFARSCGSADASRIAFMQIMADQRKESAVAILEAAIADDASSASTLSDDRQWLALLIKALRSARLGLL